jgi:general secretion pathway protein I
MSARGDQRGFTPVELLVAIIVVALAGVIVSGSIGGVVSQMYTLERRTVAHWVGENQFNRLLIERQVDGQGQPVATATRTERVVMAGREWRVDVEVADTDHPWMKRVETSVFEIVDGDDVGPLDTTVSFVGQY